MSENEVTFKLGAEASELTNAFKEAQSSFEELGHAAHALEGAFAFEAIKDAFGEVLKASADADNAERKFISTMQATGQASDPDAMFEFADSLAEVTTFSRDAGIEAAAMLGRFHVGQSQIESLLPSIADLAAYMGTDLAGAADQVGRAVAMGGRALNGLNLGFTKSQRAAFDLASEQQRVAIIQDKLAHSVAGTAEAMASTAVGGMAQLRKANEELFVSFGRVIDAPIGNMLRDVTSRIAGLKQAFDGLGDNTKNTLGALAGGLAGLGAGAAGLTSLAGALGVVSRLLPTLQSGFGLLSKAITGAFSGVLLPMAAVVAGIAGVILLVGALRQAWESNLGGMRDTMTDWGTSIAETFKTLLSWMADLWDQFSSGLSEKVITFVAMVRGISPEEAGAMVRASNQTGGGLFGDAVQNLKAVFEAGKGVGGSIGGDLKKSFGLGVDTLKAGAKAMGVDLDAIFNKLFGGTVHAEREHAKTQATGGGAASEIYALKDIFAGMTQKQEARIDASIAAKLVAAFGGSDAGFKAASAYMKNLQLISGLSEDTITTILQKTNGSVAKTTEVAKALSDVSDGTAKMLIDIGGKNFTAIAAAAAALKNMSDASVTQVAKATGGNLAAITQFGQVAGRIGADYGFTGDTLAKLLQAIGGNVNSLSRVASSMKNLTDGELASLTQAGVGIKDMGRISDSVKGLSEDLVGRIMAVSGSSSDDIVKMGQAFQGLTDHMVQTLLEVNQNNVAKAAQAAAFLKTGWGQASSALQSFFGGLMAKAGALGEMANAAMQGFKDGGPIGAMVAVFVQLASRAASFIVVVNNVTAMLGTFAQSINPLFDAISPIFEALRGVFIAFGSVISNLFKGLQPVFMIIVDVVRIVAGVLTGIFQVVSTIISRVFSALAPVFTAIMPVLNLVTQLFGMITPLLVTLTTAMNPLMPVISAVTSIFQALKPVFDLTFTVVKYIGVGILYIMKTLAQIWNGVIGAVSGIVISFGNLLGPAGDAIVKFGQAMQTQEVDISSYDAAIKSAKDAQENNTDTMGPATDDLQQLGTAAGGTSATLTNAAQGWSASLAQFQAVAGTSQSGLVGTGATTQGAAMASAQVTASTVAPAVKAALVSVVSAATKSSATTNTVTMNVQSSDPDKIYSALKAKMARDNFVTTGTSQPTTSPFAVPRTTTNQ